MYRFTDHFLVPVGVSMYADSAVFCPIDTHPPIYPNPAIDYFCDFCDFCDFLLGGQNSGIGQNSGKFAVYRLNDVVDQI